MTCLQVELPRPSNSDLLAIHDTGAYTMAMYCKWVPSKQISSTQINILPRFNSIRASPIYGYSRDQEGKFRHILDS